MCPAGPKPKPREKNGEYLLLAPFIKSSGPSSATKKLPARSYRKNWSYELYREERAVSPLRSPKTEKKRKKSAKKRPESNPQPSAKCLSSLSTHISLIATPHHPLFVKVVD